MAGLLADTKAIQVKAMIDITQKHGVRMIH
jgi:hypothetical protein